MWLKSDATPYVYYIPAPGCTKLKQNNPGILTEITQF